ncbi:hypothetical protein ACRALDRAFT_213112 [Sodiomyces alcalophilus JCM 7366]|uniref:uncharacterized protein n=1 Tax=Sodiomyces alcalophilus JCM 7366 TaxID=591952 RepID=UPI0039B54A7F
MYNVQYEVSQPIRTKKGPVRRKDLGTEEHRGLADTYLISRTTAQNARRDELVGCNDTCAHEASLYDEFTYHHRDSPHRRHSPIVLQIHMPSRQGVSPIFPRAISSIWHAGEHAMPGLACQRSDIYKAPFAATERMWPDTTLSLINNPLVPHVRTTYEVQLRS